MFQENIGDASNPSFGTSVKLDFGMENNNGYSTPAFNDIDGDGDYDLIVGGYDGDFYYQENIGDAEPAADLLEMEGMDKDLAYELAGRGVITMEDLAEQAVDELLDIDGLDKERAGALIMTARAPWFAEEATD